MDQLPSRRTILLAIALCTITAGGLWTSVRRAAHSEDSRIDTKQRSHVDAASLYAAASVRGPEGSTKLKSTGLRGGKQTQESPRRLLESLQAEAAHRLDVLWTRPGRCKDDMGGHKRAERINYLAQFRAIPSEGHWVRAHPDVEPWVIDEVITNIADAAERVHSALEMESTEPPILIYPDVDSLRRYSCANEVAVAYYDGAIHLAPLGQRPALAEAGEARVEALRLSLELRQSLSHEYVHHVLVSNGVGKPIWFQEGVATMIAGDQPRDSFALFKANPPQVSAMIEEPENAASLYEASVYYAQAYMMVEFLERLCLRRSPCGVDELAHAIASGDVLPEDLFDWAANERSSDLSSTAEVSVWADYVKYGNFTPRTYQALLHRTPTQVR
jgi:hypothetical protein